MRNAELFTMQAKFDLVKMLTGPDFVLALTRNMDLVNDEVETLEKTRKPTEEVSAFQKLGQALHSKYAKQEKGAPVTVEIPTPQGPMNKFVPDPERAYEQVCPRPREGRRVG